MFAGVRRRLAARVRPGDGRGLQRFRWWQLASRVRPEDEHPGLSRVISALSVVLLVGGARAPAPVPRAARRRGELTRP